MQFQVGIASPAAPPLPVPDNPTTPLEVLRHLLEVQREQLAYTRAIAAVHDHGARWRALLGRLQETFPDLPENCRHALPILERAYGGIINTLVEELRNEGPDALDNDYALQDFLDRYGMRLGQLGNILNLVGPLAEAAGQSEDG